MTAINFNTQNQTLRQLLGNGLTYRIPKFQRDYSWTEDEWEDLWQDIQGVVRPGGEPAHYMGYLVLQTDDNRTFSVIDGQQRLTTLSLLVLAVLRCLDDLVQSGVDAENSRRRLEQLRQTYIGYLDPVTLVPRSKLTLNRNDDGYYSDYLVPLQKLPQRGLRASQRLLRAAFEWFHRQVGEAYAARRDGAELARFIDSLADRLFFTVITVSDELNAFKVFETLNARGVRLSPTDLLKNYLFSVVSRETQHGPEIDALERRWNEMVDRLGGESFPGFLRVHWNSRRRFVRESELFKTIRAGTPGKAEVFQLLREMEEDIGLFAALSDPEDPLWTDDQRRHVAELRMYGVRQPWPLLLAARRALDGAGFTDTLRACSIVSFRYNVICGLATGDQERAYNGIALRIAAAQLRHAGDVIRALAPVWVADDPFRAAFAEKTLRTTAARNARVVRHVLFALERQATGAHFDEESAQHTLDNVLPENPGEGWPQIPEQQHEDAVHRLGNMTLLEASRNRGLGNAPFAEKAADYRESGFEITRRVAAENAEWTIDRIAARQRWMAAQATAIWRVAQLA